MLAVAVVAAAVAACRSAADPIASQPGVDDRVRVASVDQCVDAGRSVPTRMIEVALELIRQDRPEPTVHARNLFHLSAAQWDVWSAVHGGEQLFSTHAAPVADPSDVEVSVALAHAASAVLVGRYGGLGDAALDDLADALDGATVDAECAGPIDSAWAGFGAAVGESVLAVTAGDGSGDIDPATNSSVNQPLELDETGTSLDNPNRWQPLYMAEAETRNGLPEPEGPQVFFASHRPSAEPSGMSRRFWP